jgi:hypothetical protein
VFRGNKWVQWFLKSHENHCYTPVFFSRTK